MRYLLLCFVLAACAALPAQGEFESYDVEVRVRSLKGIEVVGLFQGYDHVQGLAWPPKEGQETCIIMVPELSSDTRWIWEHELRHCVDGKYHP